MHKSYGGMGFKDLSAFNLAMLGKQGWKFQMDTESLVSRIFKARYFPNNSYLTATIGHNPSYVWRSILPARFIVRGGARWSIGSGNYIPILAEPWLLNGESIPGDIAGASFVRNMSINSLMDPTTKRWNEHVVREVFSEDLAAKVLNTPLYEQVQHDKLIWKAEKSGRYSVRSAYKLCVTESHLHVTGYWLGIWKLKVPPKIKNLMWRMCRGCLPTRVRLLDKGVQGPTQCVSCDSNHEDLNHIFFECPSAVQVWNMAGLWQSIRQAMAASPSVIDSIFSLLQSLSVTQSQRLAALFWSIWKRRNNSVWEDVTDNCATVVERARSMTEEWKIANIPVVPDQTAVSAGSVTAAAAAVPAGSVSAQVRWQPPASGRLKCNIDAAFSAHRNRTGIGICLRDEEGVFVLAKTVSDDGVYPVDIGEALGLNIAVQWVSDMQLDNIDFEVDSKTTKEAIYAGREDVSKLGNIIMASRTLLFSKFVSSRVEFVRRQANAVAHTLAGEATFLASPLLILLYPVILKL